MTKPVVLLAALFALFLESAFAQAAQCRDHRIERVDHIGVILQGKHVQCIFGIEVNGRGAGGVGAARHFAHVLPAGLVDGGI